jgi:hypothetical protein
MDEKMTEQMKFDALKRDIEKGVASLRNGKSKILDMDLINDIERRGRQILTGRDENSKDIRRR